MRTLEQWAAVIEEMQTSGIPQRQWCAAQGINWGTLHAAHVRINKLRRRHDGDCPKFVQVQPTPTIPTVTITCKGITISATAKDIAAILTHLVGETLC